MRLGIAVALAAATVAAGLGWLALAGADGVEIVARSLASRGVRDVHLARAATPPSRVFQISLADAHVADATNAADACRDCRLRIRLWGEGRVRPLVVRSGTGSGSRLLALRDVLRGDARLELVSDREWLDLGALPPVGEAAEVQVVGLLPGGFTFAAIADRGHATGTVPQPVVRALVPEPFAVPPSDALQIELFRPAPVDAREIIERWLVFARASALVTSALVAAVLALVSGLERLLAGAAKSAALLLPLACVLAHAALLPPLQGADETSQFGTIEPLVWGWDAERIAAGGYPASVSRLATALEQERVQFFSTEPLPVLDGEQRERLGSVLRSTLASDAALEGARPPDATPQPAARAPAFFRTYAALSPLLQPLSVLDRLVAYRLIAAALGFIAIAAGIWVLGRSRTPDEVVIAYGASFTIPYVVAVLATCSNYAPAIGIGGALAAAATAAILAYPAPAARTAAALAVGAVTAGCLFWSDFALLALPMGGALAIASVVAAVRRESARRPEAARRRRRTAAIVAGVVATLVSAAIALFQFTHERLDDRLLRLIASRNPATVGLMAAVAVAPVVACAAVAWIDVTLARRGLDWNLRLGRRWSIVAALALLALFLWTPWTAVPFERQFLALPDFLAAYGRALVSNTFAVDQDRLSWKFWYGAFGWHDVLYPAPVYALARWAAVGFAIALPMLSARFTTANPGRSAALLATTGVALSLATTSLLLRHAAMIHPYGRFVLPWLPLVLLPVAARLTGSIEVRFWRWALGAGALFQVWTAIAVLGERYLVQR